MGRRRTGVNKVRDIIRYGQTTDLSERQIARALGVSRTVVARTLQAFRASGLEYPAVEQLADSQLQENLERGKTPQDGARYTALAERFPEMVVELKKKGVTLQWLWERYIHETRRATNTANTACTSIAGAEARRCRCTSSTRRGRRCWSTGPGTSLR